MEKAQRLPMHVAGPERSPASDNSKTKKRQPSLLLAKPYTLLFICAIGWFFYNAAVSFHRRLPPSPLHEAAVSRCRSLQLPAGPPRDFHKRKQSDRYALGTKAYLLKNAKIWTGEENGTEILHADILLDKGVIKGIGHVSRSTLKAYKDDIVTIDVKGAWVTPGCAFPFRPSVLRSLSHCRVLSSG